jgi:F0F1-type ATP synthase gamma subunit
VRPAVELKQDFDLIASHGDIIDVLKTATLIQFRSFQLMDRPIDAFVKQAEDSLNCVRVKYEHDKLRHPVFHERSEAPSVIVIVSSDDGFVGEINAVLANIALEQRRSKEDQLIVIGERGARHLEDMKERFVFFPGLTHQISWGEVDGIQNYVFDLFRKKAGRVIVVHPMFVSLMVQKIMVWQAFPYKPAEKDAGFSSPEKWHAEDPLEPSPMRVAEGAAQLWFGAKLLEVFWTSKLAEYAARVMHLEESSQGLKHKEKGLLTEYFRQVHATRDKVIREITGSRQASRRRRRV